MAIIPPQAGQPIPRQGTPSQDILSQGTFSQDIAPQHAPCRHNGLVSPDRVSVLAFSAAFRLLCMLPLLLAVWLAVVWALAD